MDRAFWKKFLLAGFFLAFFLVILWRIIFTIILTDKFGVDFYLFHKGAAAIFRGENPYLNGEQTIQDTKQFWDNASLFFPSQFLFFLPFTFLKIEIAKRVFLTLDFLAAIGLYILLFKKINRLKSSFINFLAVIGFGLFVFSQPTLNALRYGQSPIFAFLFFLIALFTPSKFLKIIMLSCSFAMKYSLFFLSGILMLIKKQFSVVIWGGVFFVAFSLIHVLFGLPTVQIFKDYYTTVYNKVMVIGGFDTYAFIHSPYNFNFIHFEFFTNPFINWAGKIAFLFAAGMILWKESKSDKINCLSLLALFCITMEISYHRDYDLVLVSAILAALVAYHISRKEWSLVVSPLLFILYLDIPFSWQLPFYSALGHLLANCQWIWVHQLDNGIALFPGQAIFSLILTCWSIFRYFRSTDLVPLEN
jgi:hypothetical protein